jgi:hypothetical protein
VKNPVDLAFALWAKSGIATQEPDAMTSTETHTGYRIEVFQRGAWVQTNERNLSYMEARHAMRAWQALGCTARMVGTP